MDEKQPAAKRPARCAVVTGADVVAAGATVPLALRAVGDDGTGTPARTAPAAPAASLAADPYQLTNRLHGAPAGQEAALGIPEWAIRLAAARRG
ncbi:hypothetical protein [Streptomyces sp. NPDC056683]|uniref:hypothetical protein n=1 Tax=Streptomyces sp. NPDC056683 TaxID=3345910 RepID=UPI003690B959